MMSRSAPIELRIEKLVQGGDGLGRYAGKVVFVPRTAPGDLVRVRIVDEKRSYARGELVALLESGPGRVTPACDLFSRCGGCQWLHLDYARQVKTKQSLLEEAVHHRLPETRSLQVRMNASPSQFEYRSRVRVHAEGTGVSRRVGFYSARSRRLVDIPSCPLLQPSLNRALAAVRSEEPEDAGLPREYDLACAEESGTWVVAERGTGRDAGESAALPNLPAEALLTRSVAGFSYAVTASSFFQANDSLIEDLVDRVADLAESPGKDSALDLFCGSASSHSRWHRGTPRSPPLRALRLPRPCAGATPRKRGHSTCRWCIQTCCRGCGGPARSPDPLSTLWSLTRRAQGPAAR